MKKLLLTLMALASLAIATYAKPHTPEPGSSERQAICDAARALVLSNYGDNQRLPQPIVFKIDRILVQEPYCNFEAFPLFKDGSEISTDYLPDLVFNFVLKKTAGRWDVIVDLSRTDVPAPEERLRIRNSFPSDFPFALLDNTWRQLLGE